MKYKLRRHKKFKTKYFSIAFLIVLIFLSISYASMSTTLRINGTAGGVWQDLSITYLHLDNTSSYPSTIKYMQTYSNTFTGSPAIESVTMGGNRLILNTDYTYTGGVLTIPNVTGNIVIDGELPELEDFTIKYVYGNNITFDGKSWINTDVKLFSQENFDRDFELTVDVVSCTYDSSQNKGQNTIFNCVNHRDAPYHGILLRRDATKYYLKTTDSATTVNEVNPTLASVQNIKVTRTNKKVYADVTNASNLVEVGDFNNYLNTIDSYLLIGSDLSGSGNKPDKCFVGELTNITLTNYYEAEEAPITLPAPDRTGYEFGGWYLDSSFTTRAGYGGETYTPTGDTVLYAKWIEPSEPEEEEEEYVYNGQYNFAQRDPVNTHVYLYTQENIHRNFEMSFNIVSVGNNNNDTLMSATKNILKIGNASNNTLILDTIGNVNSQVKNIPTTVTNIRLVRINDKLYYSLNGQTFLEIDNYTNSTSYSNNPVIFGADLDANGDYTKKFDGVLSNMSVRFISNSATIASYQPTHGQLATIYSQSGPTVFDGTNDIDLNVKLFDFDSYDKDFEISFNIDSIDSSCVKQAALVNSKYENQQAGYPGFVYRLDSNKAKLELTAAKATSGNLYAVNKENVQSVKIARRNMILYASINGETERQVYSFTGFKDFFSTKLTIGSAGPDGNGGLFRPFKGVLSDIVVKLEQ